MKVLHLSQALSKIDPKYGGAEYTDSILMELGVAEGHEVVTYNAFGQLTIWSKETPTFKTIGEFIEWSDLVLLCNIEWFSPEFILQVLETTIGKRPIVYHPHHFTPCKYIGLPTPFPDICERLCGGFANCKDSYRFAVYTTILKNCNIHLNLNRIQPQILRGLHPTYPGPY